MTASEQKKISHLNTIFETLGDSEDQSKEEIHEELKTLGVNVHATIDRLMLKVDSCSIGAKKRQLDVAREKRLQEESKTSNIVRKYHGFDKEQILEKLKQLLNSQALPTMVSVSYRELTQKSTDDLRALLEDLEISITKDHGSDLE